MESVEGSIRIYIATSFFVLVALLPFAARAQEATTTSATSTTSVDLSVATSTATSTSAVATTTAATSTATTTPDVHTNVGIEAKVRAAFTDAPIMVDVARCESRFRQYADSGNVFYGGYLNGMVGIFQLYASIHRGDASGLGFDINTIAGNIGYARYLYDNQGTDPWLDSFKCWNPGKAESLATTTAAAPATSGASSATLTIDMSLGKIDPQVLTLQKILNATGFTIASSGPGSPGQETTKYGSLTRDAVRKFQCAKNIACSGNEGSTGYGFVGARTRAAILVAYAGNTSSGVAVAAPAVSPVPAAATTVTTDANAALIAQLQTQLTYLSNILATLLAQRAEAATQTAGAATAVIR